LLKEKNGGRKKPESVLMGRHDRLPCEKESLSRGGRGKAGSVGKRISEKKTDKCRIDCGGCRFTPEKKDPRSLFQGGGKGRAAQHGRWKVKEEEIHENLPGGGFRQNRTAVMLVYGKHQGVQFQGKKRIIFSEGKVSRALRKGGSNS